MSDLKKLINKNLYLKVDFDRRFKNTKFGPVENVKFFLIGVLPVLIFYKDGEKEKASINMPVTVGRDPYLRVLQGVKATDNHRVRHYKKKVKEIENELESAFLKVVEDGKFNNKEFMKIFIINFDTCVKKN
jgi:hypothetical protein